MKLALVPKQKIAVAFALLLCTAFLGVVFVRAEQKKAPEGSILVAEKGKFNILLDGKSIGREEFEIAPSGAGWIAKGTTHLSAQGAPATTVSGTLALQSNGIPVSYDWSSQADKTNGAHVIFVNNIAKMTLAMQGASPFEQDLTFGTPLILVLDNNLYHQYAVLARLYDWAHRGAQSFSVLIPQELTPGTITVEGVGPATSDGKSYEGLKVTTSDLELMLYLDPHHRLMRIEVPATKASVVRE
jgi:hypothetical protein